MKILIKMIKIHFDMEYDSIELHYMHKVEKITNNFQISAANIHEVLFNEIRIKFKKHSYLWDNVVGVCVIKVTDFLDGNAHKKFFINNGEYHNRLNYYKTEEREKIGKIEFKYQIESSNGDCLSENDLNQSFLKNIFYLFSDEENISITKKIKNLYNELGNGSYLCHLKTLSGSLILESYTSSLCSEYNDHLSLKHLKILKNHFDKDFKGELRENNYVGEYTLENLLLSKNKSFNKTEYIPKKFSPELTIRKNFSLNFNSISSITDTLESEVMLKYMRLAGIYNTNYVDFRHFFDLNGYIVAHNKFLEELKETLYFAIASYCNSWPLTFVKRRKIIKNDNNINKEHKDILELLNITKNNIISVNNKDKKIPSHIIVFDKANNRLVVSFKGTSTASDTLKDLDCEYDEFYDGYAHTGIKKQSWQFVNKMKTGLKPLFEQFKCRDLLLTGHSLGGAISILVNMIFQKEKLFEEYNIKTIAFSSPPVVSYNFTKELYNRIFVINYGNDIVPRLCYGSVAELKYICCSLGYHYSYMSKKNDLRLRLNDMRKFSKEKRFFHKLYSPGLVYHFKKIQISLDNKPLNALVYKNVESSFFEEIIMIKHFPLHHSLLHFLSVIDEVILDADKLYENL